MMSQYVLIIVVGWSWYKSICFGNDKWMWYMQK